MERIAALKAIRDQAQADTDRAQALAESAGQQAVTPIMVQKFARTARERIRIDGGGYRREHLRALAQRVEVADGEVRIMGSKGDLLRTLAAAVRRKVGNARRSQFCSEVAEGAGFEPAIRFPAYTLSRRAPSTTRPPLRCSRCADKEIRDLRIRMVL